MDEDLIPFPAVDAQGRVPIQTAFEGTLKKINEGTATTTEIQEFWIFFQSLSRATTALQSDAIFQNLKTAPTIPLSIVFGIDTSYDIRPQDGTRNDRRVYVDIESDFNNDFVFVQVQVSLNGGDWGNFIEQPLNSRTEATDNIRGVTRVHLGEYKTGYFPIVNGVKEAYIAASSLRVRVRFVNRLSSPQLSSAWVVSDLFSVDLDSARPTITGISAEVISEYNSNLDIEVGILRDRDISHFEIRYFYSTFVAGFPPAITDENWDQALLLRAESASPTRDGETWVGTISLEVSGNYRIGIRIIDRSGNFSDIIQLSPSPVNFVSSEGNLLAEHWNGAIGWDREGATYSNFIPIGENNHLIPLSGRSGLDTDALANSTNVWDNKDGSGYFFNPSLAPNSVWTSSVLSTDTELESKLTVAVGIDNPMETPNTDDNIIKIERRYMVNGAWLAWEMVDQQSEFMGQMFQVRVTISHETTADIAQSFRIKSILIRLSSITTRSPPYTARIDNAETGFILADWPVKFLSRPFVTAGVDTVDSGDPDDYTVVGEHTSSREAVNGAVLTLHIVSRFEDRTKVTGTLRYTYRGFV